VDNAAKLGDELSDALLEAAGRYELIREVRGRGLMIGIEFASPPSLRLKAAYTGLSLARKGLFTQMVVGALFEDHQVLTQTAGDHMDVLKLLPPLVSGPAEVERFMHAFLAVMDSVHAGSRPIWHFAKGLATRTARL
jgi:4-aminobutyrate aminotransferase-like enzyme